MTACSTLRGMNWVSFPNEANAARYNALMAQHFSEFPDTYEGMREQELAYFRYFVTEKGHAAPSCITGGSWRMPASAAASESRAVGVRRFPAGQRSGDFSVKPGGRSANPLWRAFESAGVRKGPGALDH
jgi:hypothetical protein